MAAFWNTQEAVHYSQNIYLYQAKPILLEVSLFAFLKKTSDIQQKKKRSFMYAEPTSQIFQDYPFLLSQLLLQWEEQKQETEIKKNFQKAGENERRTF